MTNQRIFLVGPMGAGKTSIGKKLAALLRMDFFDSDQLLTQKFKLTIADIMQQFGEDYFRNQEQLLLAEITAYPNMVLATGGGSILWAQTREYLRNRGIVCYLQVSPEEQLQRLKFDISRPLLPAHSLRLQFFKHIYVIRGHLYQSIADIAISTDNKSILELTHSLTHLVQDFADR